MTSHLKSSDFTPSHRPSPPPSSRYILNVSHPSNRVTLIANKPSPLTERISFKAQVARKYTQCYFTWYTRIFNLQFWQQNLSISKFLAKCLQLTALFLSSRKQWVWDTKRKRFCGKLSIWKRIIKNHHIVVTSLVKHTSPLHHPEASRIYLPSFPSLYMDGPNEENIVHIVRDECSINSLLLR